MDIRYRYHDTVFVLRENKIENERPYYNIVALASYGNEVVVPNTVNGYAIKSLYFQWANQTDDDSEKHCYKGVRRLILPPGLILQSLYNGNLPDLEEIIFSDQQDNYVFSDGMLYDRGGRRLLLALRRGMQDEIRIPAKTEEIGPHAFRDTTARRILFGNPDIVLQGNPFEDSVWFDTHKKTGDTLYVGNMVFRHFTTDELVLDSSIKRISPKCFEYACPEALLSHFIPPDDIIDALNKGGCGRLTITSDCKIPWVSIRKWSSLRALCFPAHSTYKDIDGVVFDKKRNELVFYPPNRTQTSYTIPGGTVSIGCRAFMNQERVKKITLCDSITGIMPGAFCNCTKLKSVKMGKCRITELPDAGIFNDYGVFEECRQLSEVELPRTLLRIGSRAFYKAGLQEKLIINEGVESIGSFAFYGTKVTSVSLPKTLKAISPGALVNRNAPEPLSVSVYENTVYGLFEALEYVAYGREPKRDIRLWQEADIAFLNDDGMVSDMVHIPECVSAEYEGMLELAVAQRRLDRRIYLKCLAGFRNTDEKVEIALKTVEEKKDVDGICDALIRQMASSIADRYISDSEEEKLIRFLKMEYMTPEDMRSALAKCNEKGMNIASAYILHYLGGVMIETMSGLAL